MAEPRRSVPVAARAIPPPRSRARRRRVGHEPARPLSQQAPFSRPWISHDDRCGHPQRMRPRASRALRPSDEGCHPQAEPATLDVPSRSPAGTTLIAPSLREWLPENPPARLAAERAADEIELSANHRRSTGEGSALDWNPRPASSNAGTCGYAEWGSESGASPTCAPDCREMGLTGDTARTKPPIYGGFRSGMYGLEPSTFCMVCVRSHRSGDAARERERAVAVTCGPAHARPRACG